MRVTVIFRPWLFIKNAAINRGLFTIQQDYPVILLRITFKVAPYNFSKKLNGTLFLSSMIARHKDFFGWFRGGHILFLVQRYIYMCGESKLPIGHYNIIIGPPFEKIALSKFILTVKGHKLFLSECLAGPQNFYHTNQSRSFFYI